MRFLSSHAVSIAALGFLCSGAAAGAVDDVAGSFKQLKAATKRSQLSKRDHDVYRSFTVDMVFAEVENEDSRPVFSSRVQAESDKPVLNIEDFEHHLHAVECADTGSRIALKFRDEYGFELAKRESQDLYDGIVVTSHAGCNADGERKPYLIKAVSLKEEHREIEFRVEPKSWKQAFRRYKVEYGFSNEPHILRRHASLDRRQDPQPSKAVKKFTSLVPEATPTASSATVDLSRALINTEFNLPVGPTIPGDTGCKNCSTFGTLELTQGQFDIDLDVDFDFFDEDKSRRSGLSRREKKSADDIIKGGFVEMAFSGFGAHVELFSTPSSEQEFAIDLFSLPIVAFVIPGFGKAGLTFSPQVTASFDVSAPVTLTYGFDVAVPDGATVRVDLGDFDASKQTGFENTEFTGIPLQADVSPTTLTLTAALRPRFPLGFSFLDVVTAEVGVFLDLPLLELDLAQLNGVDASCSPLPDDDLSDVQQAADDLFGNLTLVRSSATLDLGVEALVEALPAAHLSAFPAAEAAVTLLSTKFPLQSACLSFDPAKTSFVPASEVLASATATGSGPAATGTGPAATGTGAGAPPINAAGRVGAPVLFRGDGVMDSLVGLVVFIVGLVATL